jgi:hypothetical protein
VRESASSIYDPEIVPVEYRAVIIETYVQALRVVFLMTVGFVVLNTLAGAMLQERKYRERLADESEIRDNEERRTAID